MPDPTEQKVATGVEQDAQAQEPGAASSATLRHALRQPLNHILGYSELLLEEAKGRQLETFSTDLQNIHAAAVTLLALIDSIVVSPTPGSGSQSPVPRLAGDGSQQQTDRVPVSAGLDVTARSFGHLMVVDDDDVNRDLLSRRLGQQGYRVSVAEDGHRALELIQTQPVDLVLLDVLMPEMDGFTTCERLKADPGTQNIPVIFMTALADTVDKVKGLQLGAVDYITKPFQQEEVLARITTHLALQRLKSSLQESEERLSRIIESAMDAIITLDEAGRIVLFNRAAERVFRCQATDAIGGPGKRILSEGLCRVLAEYVGAEPAGPKPPIWVPEGHSALRADGEAFPVEATVSHAEANGQPLYTIILRDVQERHKAEAERQQLQGLNRYLQEELRVSQAEEDLIGASQDLREVLEKVEQVAPTAATVLILGETGTGKELVARTIHTLSQRKDKVLVKLNCAAIPNDLVESELFGHEKGAFTGALSRKLGRFELADQGTLFLDEVGELPLAVQTKLLRVLQEGEFERVGGSETRKVDVRIIAATNRDLVTHVKEGSFRPDLFYRLNVFPITLPPLRQRKKDLPLLIEHFVRTYAEKYGKRLTTVPPRAMTALQAHEWPGNVRELQHMIERALILTRGAEIAFDEEFLASGPAAQGSPPRIDRLIDRLEEAERAHILNALELVGWRVSGTGGAAERLGLKPSTLEFRMKKLGITRPA
ncbi:MAG: sigma 54-interacting transcriptional regulator [Gammaproteobacteria bacterium]